MPSATEKPENKAMAEEEVGGDEGSQRESREPNKNVPAAPAGPGFFHIYKSGAGYWTRMGTAGGAALIGILTAVFIYEDLRPRIPWLAEQGHRSRSLWVALIFLIAYGIGVFWFMNRPTNAEFLIATDSEMKKVNWTSRKELIGSTRVVIGFMFLIAGFLFGIDIVFGYVFHWMGILKNPPF